jgi:hypothetical protein
MGLARSGVVENGELFNTCRECQFYKVENILDVGYTAM